MAYRLQTKTDRLAARYIPKNAHCVKNDDTAAAYCVSGGGDRVVALCFRGSAARPEINVICRDLDSATETIAKFLMNVERSIAAKVARRAVSKAWVNPLTVGEILNTCWGYDQTNVEFYVVTRVSGRRVWVREIAQDSEATGLAQGKCWPAMPIQMVGPETMHMAQPAGTGVTVKIDGHYASREDGRAHAFTTWA